jgi:hypothetical protein
MITHFRGVRHDKKSRYFSGGLRMITISKIKSNILALMNAKQHITEFIYVCIHTRTRAHAHTWLMQRSLKIQLEDLYILSYLCSLSSLAYIIPFSIPQSLFSTFHSFSLLYIISVLVTNTQHVSLQNNNERCQQ